MMRGRPGRRPDTRRQPVAVHAVPGLLHGRREEAPVRRGGPHRCQRHLPIAPVQLRRVYICTTNRFADGCTPQLRGGEASGQQLRHRDEEAPGGQQARDKGRLPLYGRS